MRYVLCLTLLVAGCAEERPHDMSPFAGFWEGLWFATDATDSGWVAIAVEPSGEYRGQFTSDAGLTMLHGHVARSGQFVGTGTWPGAQPVPLDGVMEMTDDGIYGELVLDGVRLATFLMGRG